VEAGSHGVSEMIKEIGLLSIVVGIALAIIAMYEVSIGNGFGLAGWTGQAIFLAVGGGLALYLTTEDE
jgi:hypothetical protein